MRREEIEPSMPAVGGFLPLLDPPTVTMFRGMQSR